MASSKDSYVGGQEMGGCTPEPRGKEEVEVEVEER
jgi:hypothetical protein